MLNRRILRVKAFQNLYAYEQCKASNHNLARDFIKESFLPDLNSMEVQDKAALNREAQLALEIFEKNLNNTDAIEGSDASPKVKKAVKEAIVQYRNANLRDREFLLKNMVTSAERIPQLYLTAIELIQAFADHVGKEYERKRKLSGSQAVEFSSELNLHRNQILEKLRN
ncbi:MAG: transcription antitermination factor NusB, partial [Cyclobacteriaceae bacterium]|nr:transcription antitermination factor NusB [Cyclobacteriaceae bacterium]